MLGVGPWELLIVFAIVLLLFGGKRLPGIATGLGSAIRNFKAAIHDNELTAQAAPAKLVSDSEKSKES